MIDITRDAAESLFRHPAAAGSNAAKLEEFRLRQTIRMRKTKQDERQERVEKRGHADASKALFSPAARRQSHG
ncbi:hypothetical protein [Pseudorhizobium flavum]|uniref:hypothetical protein n=1 Tax=Pseudorhizobium flavum TaxID=1335061 RepID=UPI0024913594|nr:hypothetical protein [Pseudorhizobium flavum]